MNKITRTHICFIFAVALLFSLIMPINALAYHKDDDDIEISVRMQLGSIKAAINEASYILDQPPLVVNGRSMVPLKFFTEAFGARVTWKATERSVQVENGNIQATLYINNRNAIVNDTPVILEAAPMIFSGRTLVPVKFVSEVLGYQVDWIAESKAIIISGFVSKEHALVAELQDEIQANYTFKNELNDSTMTSKSENNSSNYDAVELEVIQLVNEAREKEGLHPLKLNDRLMVVAEAKSQDMVDENYFSHTSPVYGGMRDLFKAFDVNYRWAGENIATGQRTSESVVKAWMDSPGHRANILHPDFNQMGVGAVAGGHYGGITWTQSFTD